MRLVVIAFAIAAEAGWVFVGAALVAEGAAQGPAPAYGIILAAAVFAAGLATLLSRVEGNARAVAAAGAIVSVVVVYALARVEYANDIALHDFQWLADAVARPEEALRGKGWLPLGVLVIAATWVRNSMRALAGFSFASVFRSVSIGMPVVLLAALASDALADTALPSALVPVAALNLLALALAHATRAERRSELTAGVEVTVAVAVVVAIAVVAAVVGLAGVNAGHQLRPLAEAIGAVLALAAYAVSLPIFFVIYGLLRLGLMLSGRSESDVAETLDLTNDNLRDALLRPQVGAEGGGPDWLGLAVRALQVAVAAGVLAAVMFWVYRRLALLRRSDPGERESTFARRSLRRDLRAAAGALLGVRPRVGLPTQHRPIARLYFDVLAEARKLGLADDPSRTPIELIPELVVAFNSTTPREIAGRFAAFAYGRIEPPDEETARLREEWRAALLLAQATSG